MRSVALGLCCVGMVSAAGCQGSEQEDPNSKNETTTLRLAAQDNGDFESCDAAGQCTRLPNPNDCATLVIEIDNISGRTCETCLDANGQVISATCEQPSVTCEVVTLPEPDCMLCAYINGAIVYSTCVVPSDDEITCYDVYGDSAMPGTPSDPSGRESGSDPDDNSDSGTPGSSDSRPPSIGGERCTICYDSAGNVVKYECENDCTMVACPMIGCGPGYEAVYVDNECCPVCKPIEGECDSDDDCGEGGVCIRYASTNANMECIPPPCDDANGCTGEEYGCGSSGGFCSYPNCTDVLCAMMECPPGSYFKADPSAGCCAGSCVPEEQSCYSTSQCPSGQHCSVDDGDCRNDCAPGMMCPMVCAGVCVGNVEECTAEECGPQMGMPNYECLDGSWGGPTDRCLRHEDGTCGWEVRQCPSQPGAE